MQTLCATQYRSHTLNCHTHNVVERLLSGQRRSASLGVETHQFACCFLCTKAIGHDVMPHPAACTKLGNLFKEVVVTIPKETQSWSDVVDVESGVYCRLNVGNRVAQRKCKFLHCS